MLAKIQIKFTMNDIFFKKGPIHWKHLFVFNSHNADCAQNLWKLLCTVLPQVKNNLFSLYSSRYHNTLAISYAQHTSSEYSHLYKNLHKISVFKFIQPAVRLCILSGIHRHFGLATGLLPYMFCIYANEWKFGIISAMWTCAQRHSAWTFLPKLTEIIPLLHIKKCLGKKGKQVLITWQC